MNNNLTEIIFVLDRSGSMSHLTMDTIGGYNSFIAEQQKQDGEARLTTVLFDDRYEVLHDGVDLAKVKPLTSKEYFARGMTALYDAVGKTINSVGNRLANTPEEDRPGKVIFVITTDGEENASKEYNKAAVKDMITHQTEKYNWQFLFLGANIDAARDAGDIGIVSIYAAQYSTSAVGINSVYDGLSKTVSCVRSGGALDETWKQDIK